MIATDAEVYSAPNMVDQVLPIDRIRPSSFNPRKRFDEQALQELADSIREHGLIEPIVVRPIDPPQADDSAGLHYSIVAGERRWRACKLAGLETISVRIHESLSDEQALRLALVENLQRQDLDPIEEASGYRQLAAFGMKQREIAESVHRSQPAVANAMRLLDLPEDVQERIRGGELTPAHGVALAKYKAFPQVASELSQIAIRNKATSHDLEGEIPWFWQLENLGAVRSLRAAGPFDHGPCHQCPHQAYRKVGYEEGTCLKPECFDEKKATADAERAARIATTLEQAKTEGKELPKVWDLKYDSYERLEYSIPPGCKEDCGNRGQAIDHGGKVVSVCLDPKCHKRLKMAETRAENKAGRAHAKELLAQLEKRVDGLETVGPREMAVIAILSFHADWRSGRCLDEVCTRQGKATLAMPIKSEMHDPATYQARPGQRYDLLAECSPLDLAKIILETRIRDEINNRYEERSSSSTPIADWYLGTEKELAP